jgi:uncharacterized protein YutE (UPF0331/DUF86 family)
MQFTSSIASSLAWPSAIVIVVLILRKGLLSLLPRLKRLKYKDAEAEFGNKLEQAEEEVARLPTSTRLQKPFSLEHQRLDELSANSAVFIAWLGVESTILALARDAKVLKPGVPWTSAIRILLDKGLIDSELLRTINELWVLRNVAVHPEQDRPINSEQAQRYKFLADKVIGTLEIARERLKLSS